MAMCHRRGLLSLLLVAGAAACSYGSWDAPVMRPRITPVNPHRPRFEYRPRLAQTKLKSSEVRVAVRDLRLQAGGPPPTVRLQWPQDGQSEAAGMHEDVPRHAAQLLMPMVAGEGEALQVELLVSELNAIRRGPLYELALRAEIRVHVVEREVPLLQVRVSNRLSLHAPPYDDDELSELHRAIALHALEQVFGDEAAVYRINEALAEPVRPEVEGVAI
ncbi:MAG: hypothetical protein OXT09_17015 [Myxococcales bacterium]|nr:hypothetical protein [Myxococcales bacterium]